MTNNKKTIAIVGSRPDAVHSDADIVYFINGSIQNSEHYKHALHYNHVIGGTVLLNCYYKQSGPEDDIATAWMNAFRDQYADCAIIKHIDNTDINDVVNILKNYHYTMNDVVDMGEYKSSEIIKSAIGARVPLGTSRSFHYGFKNGLAMNKALIKTLRENFKKRLKCGLKGTLRLNLEGAYPSYFRPSNGTFALLHAMHSYGYNNIFKLIGIGLDPYAYSYDFNGQRIVDENIKFRKHIFADELVIKKAAKCVDLATDDELISRKLRLPLVKE